MKVEVSSPNAESENTLCTNSILGQTAAACSNTSATAISASTSTIRSATTTTTNENAELTDTTYSLTTVDHQETDNINNSTNEESG
jgi:hypothetical protein